MRVDHLFWLWFWDGYYGLFLFLQPLRKREKLMSDFKCEIVRIDAVENHPNADRLKIVKIRGFNLISGNLEDGSARYKAGDLVIYIPEGAVLPVPMLKACGFWDEANNKGLLAGAEGNRVKAIKLRGTVSQGILYPIVSLTQTEKQYLGIDADGFLVLPYDLVDGYVKGYYVKIGDDVAEKIGAKKYVPEIPTSMSGEVVYICRENTLNFDVENIQKYPNVIREGERVVITEKLHGTFCAFGFVRGLGNEDLIGGEYFAFSKGLGAQGMVFKNNEANAGNIYQRMLVKYHDKFINLLHGAFAYADKFFLLGEIYGKGVQDLTYGESEAKFRFFAAVVEIDGELRYLSNISLEIIENSFGWERVPVLYIGPFHQAHIEHFRDGKTLINRVDTLNLQDQIREGVVIVPEVERTDPEIGRVALKAVSPDYLLRKGNATEYN